MAETIYKYYVTWVDQGPAGTVYGGYFASFKNPIETEADVGGLKVLAGAKDEHDEHIVVLDWKRIQ